jgi:hypothetical protein
MTDNNQAMNQDDHLLEEGDETPQLESGDDLAQKALSQANQSALPSANSSSTQDSSQIAETLTALQNVIERNANELDRIKEELQIQRESLKNVFENDTELNEVEEQAQLVTQKLKERKAKVQASPQVLQYKTKIGELSEQKKEIEEALNNHLLNLYQVTGAKTFDTSSGEQREFNIRATIKGSKKVLKND